MAKVMLVEDDNNLREIYEARLQAEGYTIVSAHDGEEALVVAKAEKPDLIISDVMMPKISGFEMLDILRNTDGLKDVRIIMLTALGQADDQQRADKLGADRYLVKSQVTLEDIVKTAHELLGEDAAPATATPPAAQPLNGTETPGSAAAAAPAAPATPAPIPAPAVPPGVPTPASPAPPAMPVATPPEPPAAPADNKPSAPPVTDDKTAADDKVMADAVNALVADTDAKDKATEEKPADKPTTPTKEDPTEETDPANGHVKIANKKVITPIDTGPGKDIHALLAEEEAREAGQTPGMTAEPSLAAAEAEVKQDATTSAAQETAGIEAKIEDFVAGATSEPDAPAAKPATPPAESPAKPEADASPELAAPKPETDDANPAPAITTEKTGPPAAAPNVTPTITPIVITEDVPSGAPAGSLSGNPGAPATSANGAKTPTDPNNIAL